MQYMRTFSPGSGGSRHRLALAVLLVLPVFMSRCVCSTEGVNKGDVNVISLDQEWEMGEQLAAEIGQQVTLLQDPILQAYVNQLGGELVQQTELAGRKWRFYVVADSAINAFAIPGGHVFINTGLIRAAQNESELAGVVGHEVAHGAARHGTERMTTVYGLNFVLRLVMGGDGGMLEQIAAQVIGSGAVAKFSRDDEREADQLGLQYMHTAGFEPEGMAAMFETLLQARARQPGYVERFFSSHPLTEERIETIRAETATLPARTEGRPQDGSAFQTAKQRLAGNGW